MMVLPTTGFCHAAVLLPVFVFLCKSPHQAIRKPAPLPHALLTDSEPEQEQEGRNQANPA